MKFLTHILKLPLYFIQLFTQTKSFESNPIIGSVTLNRLGLHVMRVVVAYYIFKFRQFFLIRKISEEEKQKFKEQGYLLIENFLPEIEFQALKNEVKNIYSPNARSCVQGDANTTRLFLHEGELKSNPFTRSFINNPKLVDRLKFFSAKNEYPRFYIEKIFNHVNKSKNPDPQQNAHIDTFHPTMKSWFYLEDINDGNGPLCYIEGSNKLAWKRLKWEYKRSLKAKNMKDGYSEKGSFRFSKADLKELGYDNVKKFTVPANSLVIANTFGVHFRSEATKQKATRLSIWASSRVNPFNPCPDFGFNWARTARDKAYLKYYKQQDSKFEKLNKAPAWKKVEVKGF